MKYLKYFESKRRKVEDVLYRNDDFRICISASDIFSYTSDFRDCYAIAIIPELIRKDSKYLSDENLRNIPLRDKDITDQIESFNLFPEKIKNIRNFHSGFLSGFLYNEKKIKNIPDDVYMNLTFKYYPLLEDVVKNSKTMGDIIDGFTIIYKQLMNDLPLEISKEKYNL